MSLVPTPTTRLALDEINPAGFDFWLRDDVHGAFAKLRHERPVAWHQHPDSGRGFWSLTRYDDIAAATRDWETFSSAFGIQVMTDPEDVQRLGAIRSMISTDPPRHTKLRSVVNRGFTPKVVARAEESVRRRAREIVDAIAPKGEIEFVSDVAAVLPVAIICDMMGVPEADRPRLLDLTNRLLGGGDAEYGGTKESLQRAGEELRDYGLWLGRARLEHPENDLTTTLVHAEVDGEAMPPQDLGPFFLLLIAAGNETTRNAVSHGLWALTEYPEEKRRWLADLDGRAITAAEEIVRWASPLLHMRRPVAVSSGRRACSNASSRSERHEDQHPAHPDHARRQHPPSGFHHDALARPSERPGHRRGPAREACCRGHRRGRTTSGRGRPRRRL